MTAKYETDDTIASQASPVKGDDQTLASGAAQPGAPVTGDDRTMASGGGAAAAAPPVVIRAGRQEDYPELTTVDPAHFVVGREIARGGMGRIMAARDRRLGRPVAIKELLVASPEMRARFEREARITAKLQHPAIVNLLEAGTWPTGEPFYVMTLVSGESLDKVIAARGTLEGRLALLPTVIAAVDALAYAHDARIIHRDLKPANVLVGTYGETVVIDWGLAKDLADTSGRDDVAAGPYRTRAASGVETVAGEVMGTPAYMPPEQASGEAVDERADVYALGAMLYHVLAGAPPYTGRTVDAILDAVLAGPPASLATRAEGIPPDLVTIVDKAMAHAAPDRYATAAALAADLKKFQTGQLVAAHRYSSWQLVQRWVRRHRTAVAVSAVAVVLLASVGIISVRRIVAEQARTEQQRKAAVASRSDAEDLTTFMLGDLADKLKPLGKLDLLRDVSSKAAAYYKRRTEGLTDDERSRRGRAHHQLAGVLLEQGRSDDALAEEREALAIASSLAAAKPERAEWQRDVIASHLGIADVLLARGDAAAAVAELTTAREIATRLPDSAHDVAVLRSRTGRIYADQGNTAGALAELRAAQGVFVAEVAHDPKAASSVSSGHIDIGEVLLAQGDTDGAVAAYRAAKTLATGEVERDPKAIDWQERVVIAETHLGKALLGQGDVTGALAEFQASLVLAKALVAHDPTNAEWKYMQNGCHRRIGKALLQHGDAAGALAEYQAALALSDALVAGDPNHADFQSVNANDHDVIGNVLLRQGKVTQALEQYRAAERITKRLALQDPTDVRPQRDLMACHNKIGAVAYELKDAKLATDEFSASLEISKALAAADPSNTDRQRELSASHSNLGSALALAGDRDRALGELREFQALAQALAAKDPANADWQWDLAMSHGTLGDFFLEGGKAADALASYRAGHSIFEALAGKDASNIDRQVGLAASHHAIGNALAASGERKAAMAAYASGLAIAEALLAQDKTNAELGEMVATLTKKLGSRRRR